MSKLQKLEFETKNATDRIRLEISDYSYNLRQRLNHIADYRPAFETAFQGYLEKDLPKDEIWIRLEVEQEQKRQLKIAKKEGRMNILGNPKVLPEVQSQAQKVKERLDKAHGAQLKQLMVEDQSRGKPPGFKPALLDSDQEYENVQYENALKLKGELDSITDVKFLKKQNAAKVKALENKDLRTYDLLTKEGKKQFVYDYLEEEMSDGKSLDIKVLNKEYAGMPLDKSAY